MNYLFFSERLSYGGGEKVRNWLACQLVKKGNKVYYATPDFTDEYKELLTRLGLQDYIHVIKYDSNLKKHNVVAYYRHICRLYKDNRVDAIIYFGGSLIEQLAAKRCDVKIILSERFYNGFRPLPSRALKQIQYRIADGYVFQTPEASKTYGKRAERIGTVIPNPIIDKLPEPIFDNLRKEIVTVGRLSPQKDHKTLIKAFSVFHKKYMDYKLIIYGSGELKSQLESQVKEFNLESSVAIISGKTNISEIERGAELFVLSSIAEGMPNALIEAMSVGLQCISTDCPVYGPRMLVEDGVNGYLIPVGDANKLAEKMEYAIEHKSQASVIRQNAVKIRERLAPDVIAEKWLSYLGRIIHG